MRIKYDKFLVGSGRYFYIRHKGVTEKNPVTLSYAEGRLSVEYYNFALGQRADVFYIGNDMWLCGCFEGGEIVW